jgi:hypothetical protein
MDMKSRYVAVMGQHKAIGGLGLQQLRFEARKAECCLAIKILAARGLEQFRRRVACGNEWFCKTQDEGNQCLFPQTALTGWAL